MVRGVKGEKNKHYSKTETGECYCDAFKDAVAVVNKQIYLLTKSNISVFLGGGRRQMFFTQKAFLYESCISKMELSYIVIN